MVTPRTKKEGEGDRVPGRGLARSGTGEGRCQGDEGDKPPQAGGAARRGCN